MKVKCQEENDGKTQKQKGRPTERLTVEDRSRQQH